MDSTITPRLQSLEIDRAQLERIVSDHGSINALEVDKYVELLLLWCCVVEDTLMSYGVSSMDRPNIVRWLRKTAATNIRHLSAVYGGMLDILRRSTTGENFREAFKGSQASGLTGALFSPVAHYLRCAPDTHLEGTVWFRVITQILSFPFRANLDTPSLQEAWQSYVAVDEECVTCSAETREEMAKAYSYLIDDTHVRDLRFTPRHGPGVIAEWNRLYTGPKDLRSKYALARTPAIVAYALRRVGVGCRDYGFPTTPERQPCTFMPVPKSIGKTRTICIEPAGMQFHQQGLRIMLEDVIRESPASRHIDFKSTDRSVDLARRGSVDHTFSTIDLSNASDRISYALMRDVLANSTLLPLLVACRSHTVAYRNQKRKLLKLHTSGSAACFPTETLLFTMMCQVAVWRTRRLNRQDRSKFDFAVFGDDIVISSPCVPALLEILTDCGAVVNEGKSFVNSDFTECCGHEFFKGVDVTPLRIPRKFNLWGVLKGERYHSNVESFDQCIDFANKCEEYSLRNIRRIFIRGVFDRSLLWDNPAFGTTGVHSQYVRNDHLRRDIRLSRDYQRNIVRCKRVSSKVFQQDLCIEDQLANLPPPSGDKDIDLLHWFVCSDLRSDEILSYGSAVLERRSKSFSYFPVPTGIGRL